MKLANAKPSRILLWLLLLCAVVGFAWLLPPLSALPKHYAFAPLIGLLILAALDRFTLGYQVNLQVERQLPRSLSVGRWHTVRLQISHDSNFGIDIDLYDGVPPALEHRQLPAKVELRPGQLSYWQYRVRPTERGPAQFGDVFVRLASPLKLWDATWKLPLATTTKVYPDFSTIVGLNILAIDNQASQIGIRRRPRRGEGLDFHQLRDYRFGDTPRQIDWKATARRQALITKEYQEERDQQIVLMIDSGRRMRALEDGISHFDHCLNALLMVSYVALRQGDSVSALAFGADQRWVPPIKGVGAVNYLLNNLYDLQSGNVASDYLSAAQELITRQRKRSLVILLTNTRDEDSLELTTAVRLLKKHHLVLLANLRELAFQRTLEHKVDNLDEALAYAGTRLYLESRKKAQDNIRTQGVFLIDSLPTELPVEVANAYLAIKRAGYL